MRRDLAELKQKIQQQHQELEDISISKSELQAQSGQLRVTIKELTDEVSELREQIRQLKEEAENRKAAKSKIPAPLEPNTNLVKDHICLFSEEVVYSVNLFKISARSSSSSQQNSEASSPASGVN